MQQLLKVFLDICLFRAKPEQLPYSYLLMTLAIITYISMDMWVSLITQSTNKAILATTIQTILLSGFTYAALWIRDFLNRFVKTMTAVAGTSAVFAFARYPLMAVLHSQPKSQSGMVSLLIIGLIIWNAAVLGHILRSALSVPSWGGIGIAVIYFIFYIKVLMLLSIAP